MSYTLRMSTTHPQVDPETFAANAVRVFGPATLIILVTPYGEHFRAHTQGVTGAGPMQALEIIAAAQSILDKQRDAVIAACASVVRASNEDMEDAPAEEIIAGVQAVYDSTLRRQRAEAEANSEVTATASRLMCRCPVPMQTEAVVGGKVMPWCARCRRPT